MHHVRWLLYRLRNLWRRPAREAELDRSLAQRIRRRLSEENAVRWHHTVLHGVEEKPVDGLRNRARRRGVYGGRRLAGVEPRDGKLDGRPLRDVETKSIKVL